MRGRRKLMKQNWLLVIKKFMDKKEALKILIENSLALNEENKNKLLAQLDSMSDEKIEEWGKLLSVEQDYLDKNESKVFEFNN